LYAQRKYAWRTSVKLNSSGVSQTKYTGVTDAKMKMAANPAAQAPGEPRARRNLYAAPTFSASSSA
jgi:hypothetical protein